MNSEVEAPQPAPPSVIEFTEAETDIIRGVRRQSDAKAAAELLLEKTVRPKQIRGYCCLFVGGEEETSYYGHTWRESIVRMLVQIKRGAESAESKNLRAATSAAQSPVTAS